MEADESIRMRMGNSMPHNHEEHFAGKGENSLQHYNLVHKLMPMPQNYENSCSKKQRWTRNGKNWRKFRRGTWRKSEVRKKWSMKQGCRALQFILHHLRDMCPSEKCWIGGKVLKIQRLSCRQPPRSMDIISRLPGCDGQAADAVSAFTQVKIEDAHKLLKISKSECRDIWIRPTTTQMA